MSPAPKFLHAMRSWIRLESPSALLRSASGPGAFACIGLTLALSVAPAHAQSSSTRTCIEAAGSGQALRDSGKLIDARAKFVTCAQPSCPKIIQKDCADWQRMVDERLPTVVLSAKDDAGNDIASFSVALDGAPFTLAPNGRSTPIDPGNHTFRFTATGHRPAERPFVAREGERARAVSAVLERLVKPPTQVRREEPSSGPGPLPYVLGGAGLVGAVTFVVLFSGIKSDKDEVVGTPAYTEEKREELQSRLVVADVIGGVSALVLVGSAVLFATSWRASSPKATVKSGGAPGAAMTTLQIRF